MYLNCRQTDHRAVSWKIIVRKIEKLQKVKKDKWKAGRIGQKDRQTESWIENKKEDLQLA